MNLSALLQARADQGKPVRVGLIGAGKFGTMFLAQARHTMGLHVVAVADLEAERGHTALALAHWSPLKAVAKSIPDALETGGTWVSRDPFALFEQPGLDVVIEATGTALAGTRHCLAALQAGIHVINVSLAADSLAGPLLALRARERGLVYSYAYGDQPALVCELVDWARACGFEVAAAGKGAKWLPGYQSTTPETVWQHYGVTRDQARASGMNAQMFTSFVDGTHTSLEMAAVCNATGLRPPSSGLNFLPCGSHDLPHLLKPTWDGGHLQAMGQIEVVSSKERDGRHVVGDLRWGVFVTFRTPANYSALCFSEYGLLTDESCQYAARWRPNHLVGMELGISVASVAIRGEPTGSPVQFAADVVAVAKRPLAPGTQLDGIGGFHAWGKLLPSRTAVAQNALPMGLTEGASIVRPIEAGQTITWADVELSPAHDLVALRRQMETEFGFVRPLSHDSV